MLKALLSWGEANLLGRPWFRLILFIRATLKGNFSRKLVSFKQQIITKRNPKTLNQKIRYKLLNDRRDILVTFVDKIAARDYVRSTVGEDILLKVFDVQTNPADIDWSSLPREFVCKTNHATGGNILVSSQMNRQNSLPKKAPLLPHPSLRIHPDSFTVNRAESILEQWLQIDYSWTYGRGFIEWAYSKVPRAVFVEEFLTDPIGNDISITRLYVINGKVRFLLHQPNHLEPHITMTTSRDWQSLPYCPRYSFVPDVVVDKPSNLIEMISISELLGGVIDFIRVDLYTIAGKTKFSELTVYPYGGSTKFKPRSFELEIGKVWQIEGY